MTTLTTNLPDGYKPGLEGVVAGTSTISDVDAIQDALIYRGYPAHELSENASYEEVAYLLLNGKLPTKTQYAQFQSELIENRKLPSEVLSLLKQLPAKTQFMNSLRVGLCLLGMYDPDVEKNDAISNLNKAKRLVAKMPTLVAALHHFRQGNDAIAPSDKLDYASNFLYMMNGKIPDPFFGKIFNSTMILYAEHGFNASTFAALVTSSTLSDMHSSIASAIGALKGPLHGGANEGAIEMLLKIGDESKAADWLKDALARKEKIMGFGHRVYKHQDSRAPFMRIMAEKVASVVGDKKIFPLSVKLEEAMKQAKNIFPNVDYHCAVVYYLMGLPIEVYTPIFAMARTVGWASHIIEQHSANRLIRPECFYNGERDLKYIPLSQRD